MNNFERCLNILESNNYFDNLLTEEMSTVGRGNGYQLTVYPEPLGNPSFHVIYKDEWEVVLQIKDFKILEDKRKTFIGNNYLPNWIIKNIKSILKSKIGKITHWEHLMITWNLNNPKYEISIKTKIP